MVLSNMIYVSSLFIVISVHHVTASLLHDTMFASSLRQKREAIFKINFNDLFDKMQPSIRQALKTYGTDPAKVNHVDLNLSEITHFPTGRITLNDGKMHGLSEVKRTGNLIAWYSNKNITLDMNLGWDKLTSITQYTYRYLLLTRTGYLDFCQINPHIRIIVTIDLNTSKININSVTLSHIDNFYLRLRGHLLDPMVEQVIELIKLFCRNHILRTIELLIQKKLSQTDLSLPSKEDVIQKIVQSILGYGRFESGSDEFEFYNSLELIH